MDGWMNTVDEYGGCDRWWVGIFNLFFFANIFFFDFKRLHFLGFFRFYTKVRLCIKNRLFHWFKVSMDVIDGEWMR